MEGICMFFFSSVFLFLVSNTGYRRGIRKGSLWLGNANLLILFLHRDEMDTCRMSTRKNVMQRQREKIGHSIGQWVKD